MAMTPEGKAKKEIKAYLDALAPLCFYWLPVSSGYGNSAVDIIMCYRAVFVAIEVKKDKNGKPTPRQELFLTKVQAAKGIAICVYCARQVREIIEFIDTQLGTDA